MSQLFRFPSAVKRDPAIEVWMHEHSDELGKMAQDWFEVMRDCGDDVRELLHDGLPTACSLTAEAVIGHCKECLEEFMIPKYVEFLKELPKTESGKVRKRDLL